MINILIAEDDEYIQEHFVKLFTADERFHLVGAVRPLRRKIFAANGLTLC